MNRSSRLGRLTLLPLVMCIFLVVSGGPYAMETLVSSSGAGATLLLIIVTPIVWSLPAALMTAELASAIPEEGGYYVWTKQALGPFGGFLCGWWSWVYSWVDASLYPGLFVGYALALLQGYLHGPVSPITRYFLGVAILVPLVWINIRGIKLSGEANVLFGVLLLLPFVALITIGMAKYGGRLGSAFIPFSAPKQKPLESLGSGLFVIMWSCLAWDSMSTVAGETEAPQKNFPKALGWAMLLTVASYLLPFLFGILAVPDISKWTNGAWPSIAEAVGGHWLGFLVAIGAILSVLGLCNGTLLSASRIPLVLAEDGCLPGWLAQLHPRYGTPWVGILVSASIAGALAIQKFQVLIDVDVLIYSSGLLLEFAALVVLRYKRPDLVRPYKIPGGMPVLWLLVLAPTALIAAAFFVTIHSNGNAGWLVLGALASGPVVYGIAVWFRACRTMKV